MQAVLERIRPGEKEKKELDEAVKKLLSRVQREADNIDKGFKVMLLGSASRGTWLRDEKDLDVFISFPLNYSKEYLEEVITRIGAKVLRKPEKRYAEHPYVMGFYDGYEVEIVPCYDVRSPGEMRSAVDRTPFHDEFVRERIRGKEDEVRLLKQFLKGISCYGAEAKVEGFSGYLCELLVLKYGSFIDVLEGAMKWKHGGVIALDDSVEKKEGLENKFLSPLIFIDPVDEERNVASALSAKKFGVFCYAAKQYLAEPREEFFFPRDKSMSKVKLVKAFERRGTGLVAIFFKKPEVLEDVLYTQGRKALKALEKVLVRRGFKVLSADFFVRKRVCLVYELASLNIPRAKLHLGPKTNTFHEGRFLEKYRTYEGKLTEPFISGGRWAIYLKRRHSSVQELLQDYLSQRGLERKGLPSHISKALEAGFEIKVDKTAFEREFLKDLGEFVDPRFPWEV